jgi:hypothetical protein
MPSFSGTRQPKYSSTNEDCLFRLFSVRIPKIGQELRGRQIGRSAAVALCQCRVTVPQGRRSDAAMQWWILSLSRLSML